MTPHLPRTLVVLLLPLLLLLVPGGTAAAAPAPEVGQTGEQRRGEVGPPFSLLQMNVCLSGLAGCFGGTEYPKVVDEAVERIQANRVDAVTLNEACSGDVADIAQRTGYHYTFATVIYRGAPLPCRNPEGRGVFGNAVLSKVPIRSVEEAPFSVFNGVEERRWTCATTARRVDVCTSHLSTDGEAPTSTNSVQCREVAALLASRDNPVMFGGDMNRRTSCAPEGFWTLTDAEATQLPGIQHVYGNLAAPQLELEPATYTDHDVMVVRAKITR